SGLASSGGWFGKRLLEGGGVVETLSIDQPQIVDVNSSHTDCHASKSQFNSADCCQIDAKRGEVKFYPCPAVRNLVRGGVPLWEAAFQVKVYRYFPRTGIVCHQPNRHAIVRGEIPHG